MKMELCLLVCLLLVSVVNAADSKCKICRDIAENFEKGLKDTAKSNFGGGNTHWEEKSLGTFQFSETRLVEIMENLCKSGSSKDQCHSMVEENEELIEQWWFKVFAKSVDTPLGQWLCERRLKHCCPKGTYGAECKDCTGGKDEPCSGHGSCDGDGTRGGSGKCKCSFGYAGDVCSVCGERFYEDFEEDGITKTCSECDKSCREGCTDGSPKGCHECKEGWVKSEEDGCIDYDECAEDEAPCAADEYCSNTIGSKNCLKCHRACDGCTAAGAEKCKKCSNNYFTDGDKCSVCHTSCNGCSGGLASDCVECKDGFTLNSDGECEDINECEDENICSSDEVCMNSPGKHHCAKCDEACDGCTGRGVDKCKACRVGYEMIENECKDIDECVGGDVCLANGEQCLNQPGKYSCSCKDGYKRKNKKCIKSEPKKAAKKSSRKSKIDCSTCSDIVKQFEKGMENTENLNFGGGNTKWEERKLGPYATSETRLVEIIENICDKDGNSKKCHTMVENSEEYMEKWWKDIYAEGKENSQPLYDFLCINNLQVCCQKGKFGPKCKDCSGGSMNPCQGNGDCDGEGTRSGNGTCSCQEGYTGDTCTECVEGFYEVTPSNPKDSVKCKKCHESCESQCWEAGPKGCDECKAGYTQTEANGCVDVNECTENKHECSEDEYCSNSQGSYDCKECPSGCKGCTSFDECTECQEGYLQPEGSTVCADKNECEAEVCTGNNEKCYNTPGSYSCYCEDGYQRIDDECTEIIKNEEEEMIEMTGEIKDEL